MLAYWEPNGAKEGVVFSVCWIHHHEKSGEKKDGEASGGASCAARPFSLFRLQHRRFFFLFLFSVLTTRALHWHYDPARSKNPFLLLVQTW